MKPDDLPTPEFMEDYAALFQMPEAENPDLYKKTRELVSRLPELRALGRGREYGEELIRLVEEYRRIKGPREKPAKIQEPAPITVFEQLGWTTEGPVPEVSPQDLQKVWDLGRDVQTRNPAKNVAIDFVTFFPEMPDIQSVLYRSAVLAMFLHVVGSEQPDLIAPWLNNGQPDGRMFRAAAQIPMERIVAGVVRKWPPFDAENFLKRLKAA